IVQRPFLARLAAVVMRLDVRQAAGEKYPVDICEPLVGFDARPERRYDHRQAAGPVADRGEILLPRHVKRVRREDLTVGRYSDDWSGTHARTRTRWLRVS